MSHFCFSVSNDFHILFICLLVCLFWVSLIQFPFSSWQNSDYPLWYFRQNFVQFSTKSIKWSGHLAPHQYIHPSLYKLRRNLLWSGNNARGCFSISEPQWLHAGSPSSSPMRPQLLGVFSSLEVGTGEQISVLPALHTISFVSKARKVAAGLCLLGKALSWEGDVDFLQFRKR